LTQAISFLRRLCIPTMLSLLFVSVQLAVGHQDEPAALLQAKLEMQATPEELVETAGVPEDMIAVVNNYKMGKDTKWIQEAIETEVDVGVDGPPREVSEASPWMRWISDNYDTLPEYVAFLHGDQHSWHSTLDAEEIAQQHPEKVIMLANDICRKLEEWYGGMEKSLLDMLFPALFGMSITEGYDKFNMSKNKCCTEMVVNRDAIRKADREVYTRLADAMDVSEEQYWGRGMERIWEVIFAQELKDTKHITDALDEYIESRKMNLFSNTAEHFLIHENFMDSTAPCE